MTNFRQLRKLTYLLCSSAVAFAANSVLAQGPNAPSATTPSDPSDQSSANDSQEIVVTAERRATTISKTPISISAVTGEEFDRRGIGSVNEVVARLPGISSSSAGPGATHYQIRGLPSGSSLGTGGQASAIGFYLDEISISPPALATTGKIAIDPSLYDLARVEVLRGPQGTLFGAGSMGGTIRLVTAQPDPSELAGSGRATGSVTEGGGFNYDGNVMINVPIVEDKLAVRAVGSHSHRSGWIDRIILADFPLPTQPSNFFFGEVRGDVTSATVQEKHKNVNDVDITGGRVSLLATPTERLSITASTLYQKISIDGLDAIDFPPGRDATYQPFDVASTRSDKVSLNSLVVEYDFDWAKLTSATGYIWRRATSTQDQSEETQSYMFAPAYRLDAGGLGAADAVELNTTRQFSQEVRLTSNGNGRLQWIVGGYLERFRANLSALASTEGTQLLFGANTFIFFAQENRVNQVAAFANISYKLTDTLKLSAGGRYFRYKAKLSNSQAGIFLGGDTPTTVIADGKPEDGINPSANLSWTPSNQLLLYASAARGFRVGGANFPVTRPICLAELQAQGLNGAPDTYDSDSVWTYEIGEKARLFGNRLSINSSAYYTKWDNIQRTILLQCASSYTGNAGTAVIKGGEIEARLQLSDDLSFSQAIGYTDARFTEDSPLAGIVDGDRLLLVPRWTGNSTLDFRHEFADRRAVRASITASYRSKFLDQSYTINTIPGYTLVNATLGVEVSNYSIQLFANNLFNKRALLQNSVSNIVQVPSFRRGVMTQPRTIGITLNGKF